MKKHVYLFDENCRSAVYGIGTYIRQMIVCLVNIPDIELHVVHIAADVKCFEIKNMQGYDIYNIPEPCSRVGEKLHIHEKDICYLLRLNFKYAENDNHTFLFNYMVHLSLIPFLKEWFSNSYFYFAIHFQGWCFSLNGDISYFKQIIYSKGIALSASEQEVYDSYIREKKLYQTVDKVICLSKFTLTLLNEEYGIPLDKLIFINNGLKDERTALSVAERNILKRRLHFSSKEKIILFVGRLDVVKGVELLLMSFLGLLQKNKNYRLVIIGDGDFSSILNKCGTDWSKVTFTGHLDKERLYDFYQIADVGVMPSMHEQCSYVAIEMMMFGLPMVISKTTGLKEMMQYGEFGYTFDIENRNEAVKDKLSDLIIKVLKAPSWKRVKMKTLSRFSYEKKYSEQDMRRMYLSLIFSDQY